MGRPLTPPPPPPWGREPDWQPPRATSPLPSQECPKQGRLKIYTQPIPYWGWATCGGKRPEKVKIVTKIGEKKGAWGCTLQKKHMCICTAILALFQDNYRNCARARRRHCRRRRNAPPEAAETSFCIVICGNCHNILSCIPAISAVPSAQRWDKIRTGQFTPLEDPPKWGVRPRSSKMGGGGDANGHETCAVSVSPYQGGFKMAAYPLILSFGKGCVHLCFWM